MLKYRFTAESQGSSVSGELKNVTNLKDAYASAVVVGNDIFGRPAQVHVVEFEETEGTCCK